MSDPYAVLAPSSFTTDSAAWENVVTSLQERHGAKVLRFANTPMDLEAELKALNPRYVAIVDVPENIGRDYVIALNQMSRRMDNDPYADFLWGIVTGRNAAAAQRMLDHSATPMEIHTGVGTIKELEEAKWFDTYAVVDDHEVGMCGEKKLGEDSLTHRKITYKTNMNGVKERIQKMVEKKFGRYFSQIKWLNFGGGHHITRKDYDREKLISVVKHFREKYDVEVYLEPGEAVVLNAGFLVSTVLETMNNGMDIAILDTSAACHMPDVLEMPYRPPVRNSKEPGEKAYTFRLTGPTCLAGDVIGDYSFDEPLKPGDQIILEDMALYTMVKTNTFNGMPLPDIVWEKTDGEKVLVKKFGYEDFKGRLS